MGSNSARHGQVAKAVAFGDFLRESPRVQAADVGIELVRRKADDEQAHSATDNKERLAFLKQVRAKNAALNLQPYQEWMSKRSHQKLA